MATIDGEVEGRQADAIRIIDTCSSRDQCTDDVSVAVHAGIVKGRIAIAIRDIDTSSSRD